MLLDEKRKGEIDEILKEKGAINFMGYQNPYGFVVITDKDNINETGVIGLGSMKERIEINTEWNKRKVKLNKYFFLDKKKHITFDEFYGKEGFFDKILKINSNSWFSMGIDVVTNTQHVATFKELTNIHIAGGQGSGKSVDLFNLFYQLYNKEYAEFIIFDKGDLQPLEPLPKVIAAAKIDESGRAKENFFQFYNYLMFEYKRRREIFNAAWVSKYYDYMEKFYKGEVEEPMNQIFAFLDEFNSWRFEIWQIIGTNNFDKKIGNIINKLRASGVSLIAATQVLMKSQIGVVGYWGFKGWYYGVVHQADTIRDTTVLDNLQNKLKETYLFYSQNDNSYLKLPYVPSAMFLKEKLEVMPLKEDYKNVKSPSFTLLVNNYIIKNKEISIIMRNYEKVFQRLGLEEESIKQLEKSFLFIPFCVLAYKVLSMHDKGVLDTSYELFQSINFALESGEDENIDAFLQENIEIFKSKDEEKFIQEVQKSFNYSSNPPEDEEIDFVEYFGSLLKRSLIRRGLISNRIERNMSVKKETNASISLDEALEKKKENLAFMTWAVASTLTANAVKESVEQKELLKEENIEEVKEDVKEDNPVIKEVIEKVQEEASSDEDNKSVEETQEETQEEIISDEDHGEGLNENLTAESFDTLFSDDEIIPEHTSNTMEDATKVLFQ